jgi:hypothetical protein
VHKLEFYVPAEHVDTVNEALFAAGAGRIGEYDRCCWVTEGTGQFRPLEGSTPFIGRTGEVERVTEAKVEMVVADELLTAVVNALLAAHPYETPAYAVIRVETLR